MRALLTSLLMCGLCLQPKGPAQAEIVVVVHPDSPIKAISAREVSDLYMGRTRNVRTENQSTTVAVIEQSGNDKLRESFFRQLNGISVSQLNAYWARLRYSGDVLPPPTVSGSSLVIESVRRRRDAIGYINASEVTASVRVVLTLRD